MSIATEPQSNVSSHMSTAMILDDDFGRRLTEIELTQHWQQHKRVTKNEAKMT